ncbi:unnamed protein product [Amoebophrya sp. A120]|nr:unnamed protein product [Amoebophrya sp. A120]|eukprot:GSA120T00025896001.1
MAAREQQQQPGGTPAPNDEVLPSGWARALSADGKPYYYNRVTMQTQWVKPVIVWKEYTVTEGASAGKKYYYNTETKKTQWECPLDLLPSTTAAAAAAAGSSSGTTTAGASTSGMPGAAKVEHTSITESRGQQQQANADKFLSAEELRTKYPTPEDRRAQFVTCVEQYLDQVYKDTGKFNKLRWEDVAKKLDANDNRFQLIESGGDRKQIFHEVLQRKEVSKRDEIRKAKHHARHDLLEVLRSRWPGKKRGARFRDAYEFCSQFDCWKTLLDDNERDEVFQEFQDAYDKEDREERKKQKMEKIGEFAHMLAENPDILRSKITWREVEKMYEKDPVFQWLHRADALAAFEKYLKEVSAKMLADAKRMKFRRERDARVRFRKWLRDRTCESTEDFKQMEQHLDKEDKAREESRNKSRKGRDRSSSRTRNNNRDDGGGEKEYLRAPTPDTRLICVDTTWAELINWYNLTELQEYKDILGATGSGPTAIYNVHVDDLLDSLNEDRQKLQEMMDQEKEKSRGFVLTKDTTLEEFRDFIRRRRKMNSVHIRILYNECVKAVEEEKIRNDKAEKKSRQKLVQFLAENKNVGPELAYKDADKMFKNEKLWNAVAPTARQAMFYTFIEQISKMNDEDEAYKSGSAHSGDSDFSPDDKKTTRRRDIKDRGDNNRRGDHRPARGNNNKKQPARGRRNDSRDDSSSDRDNNPRGRRASRKKNNAGTTTTGGKNRRNERRGRGRSEEEEESGDSYELSAEEDSDEEPEDHKRSKAGRKSTGAKRKRAESTGDDEDGADEAAPTPKRPKKKDKLQKDDNKQAGGDRSTAAAKATTSKDDKDGGDKGRRKSADGEKAKAVSTRDEKRPKKKADKNMVDSGEESEEQEKRQKKKKDEDDDDRAEKKEKKKKKDKRKE